MFRDKYLLLALATGIILGTAVTVSRYAYNDDASGIVVSIMRAIVMVLTLAIWLKVSGTRWPIPKALIPHAVLNGALMGVMTFGNIGAVEFISIGLAALLFFTFPIMIAVLVIALRVEHVRPVKLFALILAFLGLALMLGVSIGSVDWRGPAFSLTAAVCCAINAILVGKHFVGVNVFITTFHFSVYSLITLALIGLLLTHTTLGDVRLPLTMTGWAGALAVAILQGIGTPMYLYAILKIGALKTGMVTNIQPVTSIAQAWVIFGEVLSLMQALGGLLVLVGIGIMQWADLQRLRPNRVD